ncbi:MAG TPA: ABC transporter ATP-binding protein [Candidatus Blautia excrementipullorum]|nr:ABC transporter ATP-binding protein [Candidatus Blautia excrementipullorum]
MLEVNNFSYAYGRIRAVDNISFYVEEGEIVTLIGGNGAGKTTTLRAISGLIRGGQSGSVLFEGKEILGMSAHRITGLGIAQCLEGRQVFPHLTVKENLQMGAFLRKDKDGIAKDFEYVYSLFPRLKEREHQMAGTLSGGEQQMLAVGRGLMMNPKLLMMDEPSLGLAPIVVNGIFDIIKKINADGKTILLVEQNSNAALSVAHRGYVVETGHIVMSDTAKKLRSSEEVRKAYLGLE